MNRIFNLIMMGMFSALLASQALAHSDLEMTVPENEAVLDEGPETVSIQVAKKIRLIKVEMQHEDSEVVVLDSSQYQGFEKEFTFAIKPMGTGTYSIAWRALGEDGHPIQGKFTFTVME